MRCWMVCREVHSSWLDLLDGEVWFWQRFERKNGLHFLAMVVARSKDKPLELLGMRIDELSGGTRFMKNVVLENAGRIQQLTFDFTDEDDCFEVMAREFGILKLLGIKYDSGWQQAMALDMPLGWLGARIECVESLSFSRVLVPLAWIRNATHLRHLSLVGARSGNDDRRMKVDMDGVCLLGGALMALEELEIGGEIVVVDTVARVNSVKMGRLRRLRLDVGGLVIQAVMSAFWMPAMEILDITGEGEQDVMMNALVHVREIVEAWGFAVGHLKLGEVF